MDNKTKNGLIVLGIVVVLGVVAMRYMKMMKDSKSDGINDNNTNPNPNNNPNPNPIPNPNTTKPLAYSSLADTLFEAMDGYGTNEDSITEVFRSLRNQADFDALEDAFGTRKISSGTGNIFQGNYNGRLIGALKDELDSEELADLNNLLRSKKIKAI
jgi:hypothetical protein